LGYTILNPCSDCGEYVGPGEWHECIPNRTQLMYEDELPEDISDEIYSQWFENSFVDFVRVGPKITKKEKKMKFILKITPKIDVETRHRIQKILEEDGYNVIGGGQTVNNTPESYSSISFERMRGEGGE